MLRQPRSSPCAAPAGPRLVEAPQAGRDQSQQARLVFLGGLEQQLHAQADAEHRLAQCPDHVDQAVAGQHFHGMPGGPDPGQNDAVGRANGGRRPP
jgi:hypothetical protein